MRFLGSCPSRMKPQPELSHLIFKLLPLAASLCISVTNIRAQDATDIIAPPAVFMYTAADFPFMSINKLDNKSTITFFGDAAKSTATVVQRALLLTPIRAVIDDKGTIAGLSLTAIPGFLSGILKPGDVISHINGQPVRGMGLTIDAFSGDLASLGNSLALDLTSTYFTIGRVNLSTGLYSESFFLFEMPA